METGSTKFVGRISLSAESLHNQFIIGRYGNLPYVGWISLSAESLHNQFIIGRYGNLPYIGACRVDIPIRRIFTGRIKYMGKTISPDFSNWRVFSG
jgi:hypothetical protein